MEAGKDLQAGGTNYGYWRALPLVLEWRGVPVWQRWSNLERLGEIAAKAEALSQGILREAGTNLDRLDETLTPAAFTHFLDDLRCGIGQRRKLTELHFLDNALGVNVPSATYVPVFDVLNVYMAEANCFHAARTADHTIQTLLGSSQEGLEIFSRAVTERHWKAMRTSHALNNPELFKRQVLKYHATFSHEITHRDDCLPLLLSPQEIADLQKKCANLEILRPARGAGDFGALKDSPETEQFKKVVLKQQAAWRKQLSHPWTQLTADARMSKAQALYNEIMAQGNSLSEERAHLISHLVDPHRSELLPPGHFEAIIDNTSVLYKVPDPFQDMSAFRRRYAGSFWNFRPTQQDHLARLGHWAAQNRAVIGSFRGVELLGNLCVAFDWTELFHLAAQRKQGKQGLTDLILQGAVTSAATGSSLFGSLALFGIQRGRFLGWAGPLAALSGAFRAFKILHDDIRTHASNSSLTLSGLNAGLGVFSTGLSLALARKGPASLAYTAGSFLARFGGGRWQPMTVIASIMTMTALQSAHESISS